MNLKLKLKQKIENKEILSAFALCDLNKGAKCVKWKNENKKYIVKIYLTKYGIIYK
ncbi:hypothetical protein [Clostridium thermobutyricum]|uniref:Uncharacterized protein n=1 Tax=Clostridium thermobutyricum DSM 4928 TaxID=1121339 RepID=A0A1V4SZ10_9CLOT|nr:hypothetical protein [Clostridium thermobutyricum]OPX49550.1 hypothetical protein CLTHE_06470 [Clostridium thermobutyricum DSM 4928]